MSSSSSLSGARRRRVGGGSGPTSTTGSTPSKPAQKVAPGLKGSTENNVINPYQLIQQHDIKLNILHDIIQELKINKNNSILNNIEPTNNSSINIDMEEICNNVMLNVEKQLDLKVFYENDERLMNEIESLKLILQSQQLVINGLSTALYSVVSKLNLSLPHLEPTEELSKSKMDSIPENVADDVADDVDDDVADDVVADDVSDDVDDDVDDVDNSEITLTISNI